MRQPVLIVLLAVIGNGQTRVDLASQGRNIDFSRAASTKPFKTGAVLPVTCSLNEVFLKTDDAGNTLYSCSIANQWSQVTSGGNAVTPLTFSAPLSQTGTVIDCPTCLRTGSISMGANQTTFTYNSATGAIDGLKLVDGGGNTGTGILGHFTTASGSSMSPWQADANGVGWRIASDGSMQPVNQTAAGTLTLQRGTGTSHFGLQGATAGEWRIKPPANFTSWDFTPPTSPCGASQWMTTDGSGVGNCTQPTGSDLALSDVTTNNATAGRHGFLPKLSGNAGDVLNGLGAFVAAGAGGGSTSPLTTKGDIWVYGTANARLAVGSNGQALVADSTQPLGLKYASLGTSTAGAPYTQSFTAQTNIALTHNLALSPVTAYVLACFDGSGVKIQPASETATNLNTVMVTFAIAQTGSCTVATGGGTGGSPAVGSLTGFGAAGHVIRSTGSAYADSAIQAGDIPTLNQNTTGTAAGITGKTFVGTATQIPLLSGTPGGSKCIHTDGNGNLTEAGADCASPMAYPAAGVTTSTGGAWGMSYTVGTGANNLVQLNGSSQLPALSAALLTNFPILNQNTTGTAGAAPVFAGSNGVTVSSSATPAFSFAASSSKSPTVIKFTPIVSVTTPSFTNLSAGARALLFITTDGTHTWSWNSTVADNVCNVWTTSAATTIAEVFVDPDGTTLHGGMCIGGPTGLLSLVTTGSVCTSNPASGVLCVEANSTDNTIKVRDSSGKIYATVLTAASRVANQFVTHIASTGIPATAAIANADLPTAALNGVVKYTSGVPSAIGTSSTNCVHEDGSSGACSGSGGDFSSNTSTSVDGEVVLFSGTAGKTGKRATGTGIARLLSGVQSAAELSGDASTSGSNAVTLATKYKTVRVLGYELPGTGTAGVLQAADFTAAFAAAINNADAKTLTEASCISDTGSQTITVSVGGVTRFTITCVSAAAYAARTTTDGSEGFRSTGFANAAIAANAVLNVTGTANGTTTDLKVFAYGTVN